MQPLTGTQANLSYGKLLQSQHETSNWKLIPGQWIRFSLNNSIYKVINHNIFAGFKDYMLMDTKGKLHRYQPDQVNNNSTRFNKINLIEKENMKKFLPKALQMSLERKAFEHLRELARSFGRFFGYGFDPENPGKQLTAEEVLNKYPTKY